MKLSLCNLAATVTSSAAATQSANDTVYGAIISSFVSLKYLLSNVDLPELGDHENIHAKVY